MKNLLQYIKDDTLPKTASDRAAEAAVGITTTTTNNQQQQQPPTNNQSDRQEALNELKRLTSSLFQNGVVEAVNRRVEYSNVALKIAQVFKIEQLLNNRSNPPKLLLESDYETSFTNFWNKSFNPAYSFLSADIDKLLGKSPSISRCVKSVLTREPGTATATKQIGGRKRPTPFAEIESLRRRVLALDKIDLNLDETPMLITPQPQLNYGQ